MMQILSVYVRFMLTSMRWTECLSREGGSFILSPLGHTGVKHGVIYG